MHRQTLPRSPRELNPAIPPTLEQIVLKVLAKEPSARYRTADQMGRVLTNFSQQASAPTTFSPSLTPTVPSGAAVYPDSGEVTSREPSLMETKPGESPAENPLDIDWITIGLGLLALIAVGGLVPFFLWVYFVFNPPFH